MSEDPSEFVERIRQLGEQRDQQDTDRVKKLEEDLIQGRSERLARRAERARSISPDKPTTPQSLHRSPTHTHTHTHTHTPQQVQDKAASTPTPAMSPPPPREDAAREESLQQLTGPPAPVADDGEPKKAATSAAALGRSGTLSWKQRPQSGSIRRPMSVASSFDRPGSRDASTPSSPERPASRAHIAASLGAKDPAYFRQTADRGLGSAAYRRSDEDNASDAGSLSGRRQLPGMARDSTVSRDSTASTREPELATPPTESAPSSRPTSRGGSMRGSTATSNRFSAATSLSGGETDAAATRSPLPTLDSHKFTPPSESGTAGEGGDTAGSTRGPLMSPTQGRISPERERPVSPTKGMGGFVLSASLKRSDSVSKRWSTQAPPTLSRQSSTLSNRGSAMAGFGSHSRMERPTSLSREQSAEPLSRPQSSSSNITMKGLGIDTAPKDEFVRPALPNRHSRSKSVHSTFSNKDQSEDGDRPSSPSKRFNPTKSSWLENALNKPESPKLMAPASPQQPAWMAELSRAKQQRGSVDLGKASPLGTPFGEKLGSRPSSPIKEVQLRPVALRKSTLDSPKLESPKLDALKLDSSKFDPFAKEESKETQASSSLEPAVELKPSSPLKEEIKPLEEVENVEESKPAEETAPADSEPVKTALPKPEPETAVEAPQKDKEAAPSPAPSKSVLSRFPPAVKPKPDTPPKKDFRAGLKSRQTPTTDAPKSQAQSELQNVFGKLRKAETKNFVAPDVFKSNIVGGKNALNVTGGPKPTVRRDEFRESLKEKRSSMLEKAQEEGSALKRSESISKPTDVPEAIAVRGRLDRSKSISKFPPPAKEEEKKVVPEALARKKSLRGVERPNLNQKDEKPASPAPLFAKKDSSKPNKLADRFNPALAGMLARGPPPLATEKSTTSVGDSSPTRPAQEEPSGPAPELTHMTKGRARGPKRRTPAAKKSAPEPEVAPEEIPEKVNATVAAVPLVKPKHILPSSEPPKANGTSEESPVTNRPVRNSIGEKPTTPAKPRQISAKFDKAPTPEVAKKPLSIDLEKRVSGTQSIPKQSPRPESIGTPKTASPSVPKKSERITSGAYNTAQPLPKPESIRSPSITSIKSPMPTSPSPSPSVASSRFSRPLPTPPPKESPKPAALREIPTPNAEVSPVKDESSPQKLGFSSVKNATALWGRQSTPSSPAPLRTKSPIKLPTQADEKAAMKDAGLVRSPEPEPEPEPKPESPARPESLTSKPLPPAPLQPKPKPTGLGFSLGGFGSFGSSVSRSREPSPRLSKDLPMSPPRSADRSQPDTPKAAPAPAAPKHDGLFAEFFDEAPLTEGQLPESIDVVQVLHSPPYDLGSSGKIRTQKQQIQEITGDGKMLSIPAHEQHVLFQDSMYVCTHVYSDSKGAKNIDVYLWAGNSVAESNIEDAQLFARNHAKQNQARLLVLRQGNEPPNFFDALGGIVITRRGSKPASKQFMLCGRRHLGHLAFDEVDFALKSFCSAFVYLISTEAGKVHLWKGRGCSAEELSGARLMGMDLAPTGDFQEIDEGSEPSHLIDIFPPNITKGPAIPRSADHWRYKATSDRYRARLYKIDQQQEASGGWGQSLQVGSFFANLRRGSFAQSLSPTSTGAHAEHGPQTPITPKSPLRPGVTTKVVEIMPFCQRDLEPEYIYVLDAFFEMYIIVGALARSQAPAFSTALMFAQEYGILAVSEEDRPFMPVTTIVLEGVPRDMKAVFRHWNDALIPTAELMSGSLKRGKSLRIVGLEKAIQATRG
ncbi:hypothetical protein ST47_g8529 [Ascochyta rabiei]|uniref:Uncharacterized protein n=1 Tax=Didymella rabiei TaxID=5454 RepID=A0A162Z233_DIDRA|nr:hypothetical protein ST47_g8529 [Ascochyta rabiei]